MTLTLELTPEEESTFYQAAQRAGMKPEEFARMWIKEMAAYGSEPAAQTPLAKRTLVGYRMFAEFGGGMVEALHEERAKDNERDNPEFED